MFPYFILILLPSIFALFNTRSISLVLWFFTFIIYVIFVGFRYEVGPDWWQYGRIHDMMGYLDFWETLAQGEPLSHMLFWISEHTGSEVYLTNVVAAIITLLGVFTFARRTTNPWIAVVAATPYFIIVMGMSGIRQAMAAGIILFLLSRWERYSFLTRGLWILIAAMFHTSALVNNIFLVAKMNIAVRYKLLIGAFIMLITLYLGFEVSVYSENVMRYRQRYLEGSFVVQSFGSFYHIAMVAIPALIGYIYRKRIMPYIHSSSLLYFGLHASLGVTLINFFSSTAASRLTIYLYFLPMMIYPALVNAFGPGSRLATAFAVIFVNILLFVSWFTLGNVAFAYLPYQNVLFHD